LKVGYFIETDGVPDSDQAHLSTGHIEEQIGKGS
jgi:hypothetical protein